MTFGEIVQEVLNVAGTFNLELVILLFIICSVGEFGLFSIPYLLETIWLMSGYNLGAGTLSPFHLVLLWLVAQAGRQTGATVLYYFGRFGTIPVIRLYRKYIQARLSGKLSGDGAASFKFFGGVNYLSPVSVAIGRLFGLRIPLTLAVGVKRRLGTNVLGVLFSSLVWDGIYISLGVAGGRTVLKPAQMMLYSLIGLTLVYAITLTVRQLRRRRVLSKDSAK